MLDEKAARYPYVHVSVPPADAELVGLELFELGAGGVEERDATTLLGAEAAGAVTLIASFEDDATASRARAAFDGRFPARIAHVVGDDWADAWRAYFEPTRIGGRLYLRPSWRDVQAVQDDVVLTIDPGRAFGSGIHESTRLVLREVDRRVRGGETVLDVGCGSGILAVAALLLGAKSALAIDVDPAAIEVSRENAKLNRVKGLRAATTPVTRVRGEYDLVLANIQAEVLVPMAPALIARLAPRGTLVLAGLLLPQLDDVAAAFAPLVRRVTTTEGEWGALVMGRSHEKKGRGVDVSTKRVLKGSRRP